MIRPQTILLLFVLLFAQIANAQLPANFNLVANGGFFLSRDFLFTDTVFDNSACWVKASKSSPSSIGELPYSYWRPSDSSFHITVDTTKDGIILNTAAECTYVKSVHKFIDTPTAPRLRQYAENKLLEPLQAGVNYKFTMHVLALRIDSATAPAFYLLSGAHDAPNKIKNLGVYFSKTKVAEYGTIGKLNFTPQLNFVSWSALPIDTMEYVALSGWFTATGGEQYITIGNFDYWKDMVFQVEEFRNPYFSDTIRFYSVTNFVTDVSLVRDTTQPMISLAAFDLGPDTTLCPGNTLTLGGQSYFFHYLWNTGDTTRTIQVTTPGKYWCSASFDCGTTVDTIEVRLPTPIAAFQMPDTTVCANVSLTINAPPGFDHYLWSNGSNSPQINIAAPGTYWVKVGNACSQSATDTFSVSNFPSTIHPFSLPDTFICGNNILIQSPIAAPHYLWNTGATTASINVSSAGNYWLKIYDDCGQSFTDSFIVTTPVSTISLGDDTTLCSPQPALVLSVPNNLQNILWSNGANSNTITVNQPGIYFISALSQCGWLHDTIEVKFCPPVIDTLRLNNDTICAGSCIQPMATTSNYPVQYLWTFAGGNPATVNTATPPAICYATPGVYLVILTISSAGGTATAQTSVTVLEKPMPRFEDTAITISYKKELTLYPCADAAVVDWYKNDSLVCSNCSSILVTALNWREDYHCIVSNGSCSDSCHYLFTVIDIPHDVWMPSAFSPNGDGRNDIFRIITDNPNVKVQQLNVYNRYGQRVFVSNLNNGGWDGTYSGVAQPVGVYFWDLQYMVLGTSETFYQKGDITLVR
ncbi:T9SS type B sorting domain-containing protein [Taibaiella soli]|uniref:PKD domain-containing protein n=1 Tax=Taibaiella soli TaxID=1649169 RepID=A0A2W2AFG2_9BACT|nr:gliding motility-associated C-terminal domain-containing protein [Taibaiella soli]PZF70930.1 hypothetical protein DN068_21120 [Taibaiella soli]